ncbi:MAG: hypothetical protein ABGX83_00765 [Nitrospira sp.]|nr:hypothetical protein [Candidatus Manganitrophaceae bacterium]HIL35792.1 hypothetical protein [Candidatus Manganitrophaceae bacterium]
MQKRLPPLILLIVFLLWTPVILAADGSLKSIQKQVNEIYRIAQDMVEHGSDGHTDEIVSYGRKILERAAVLLEGIKSHTSPEIKNKENIIDLLREMTEKTEAAVRFGEKHKRRSALASAEKASFRAKKLRQRLLALK